MTDYTTLANTLESLIENEHNMVANMANTSALLFEQLGDINWVGFYIYDTNAGDLVLGPFQGKVACVRIPLTRGVCGAAASTLTTQRVADVHAFPDHIACDSASNSELVIPLMTNKQLFGVLDIDSPTFSRFTEDDQNGIERIAGVLMKQLAATSHLACDNERVI